MQSPRNDENYPLLLLFLEDEKKPKRGIFFEKSRYTKISEGAGNILIQWPRHISSIWLTSSCCILLFLITLLMVALIAVSSPSKQTCAYKQVEGTKIYLIHYSDDWSMNQVKAIEEMIQNYPKVQIQITNFHSKIPISMKINKKRFIWKNSTLKMDINVGKKDVLKNIQKEKIKIKHLRRQNVKIGNLSGLIKTYPFVTLKNESVGNFFIYTPLYKAYKKFNMDLLIFSARIFQLWEHGGISFEIPVANTNFQNSTAKIRVKNEDVFNLNFLGDYYVNGLIKGNLSSFEMLPKGVVNIDEEGLHMETKTPCHAFFGEMLANLRGADRNTTAKDIIRRSLKRFCLSGAVSDEYCLTF